MSDYKCINQDGKVTVLQQKFTGMVTLRADLSDAETVGRIEKTTGLAMPEQRKITGDMHTGLAWMSLDELMIFCKNPAEMVNHLNAAISGTCLAVDVSHARAVFELRGNGSREVLAKGAPVDLSPDAFAPGDFRRTRMGQVAVAFWMMGQSPDRFGLICFASVQEFMFEWLVTASQKGSLPEYF